MEDFKKDGTYIIVENYNGLATMENSGKIFDELIMWCDDSIYE